MNATAQGDPATPMEIISATYDGLSLTVKWKPFSATGLTGYVVSLLHDGEGMNNVMVENPAAVSSMFGVLLKAGDVYKVWLTPVLRPGRPDTDSQSNVVEIPYPAATAATGGVA
ncbi:hypothetical protein [Stenotrophomonas sp. GZD-301]|uniref:hypothetical protein n=1 Tax=Stenotrophomonas sp. GZD-301 TaxID=3404814 RepID=UPI003BB6ABC0